MPCIYTRLPLDGMARNIFNYMDTQEACNYHAWFCFYPTTLYPREKTIWNTLGSNPARKLCQLHKRARYPLRHRLLGKVGWN